MQPNNKPADKPAAFELNATAVGDDLYVNDGAQFDADVAQYFDMPVERKQEEREQAAALAAPAPALSNTYEWFVEQIRLCDRLDNVQTKTMTINGVKVRNEISIEGQVFAYQLLKTLLTDKAAEFQKFAKEQE